MCEMVSASLYDKKLHSKNGLTEDDHYMLELGLELLQVIKYGVVKLFSFVIHLIFSKESEAIVVKKSVLDSRV